MLGAAFFTISAGDTFFGLLRGDIPVEAVVIQHCLLVAIGQNQLIIAIQIFWDRDVDGTGEAITAAGTEPRK